MGAERERKQKERVAVKQKAAEHEARVREKAAIKIQAMFRGKKNRTDFQVRRDGIAAALAAKEKEKRLQQQALAKEKARLAQAAKERDDQLLRERNDEIRKAQKAALSKTLQAQEDARREKAASKIQGMFRGRKARFEVGSRLAAIKDAEVAR